MPLAFNPELVPAISNYFNGQVTKVDTIEIGDINNDGKVYIDDAYLVARNLSGAVPFNTIYWFTSLDYSTITLSNFNTITPSTHFTVNFTTSSVTLNIKYIVLGDTDLSSSSQ